MNRIYLQTDGRGSINLLDDEEAFDPFDQLHLDPDIDDSAAFLEPPNDDALGTPCPPARPERSLVAPAQPEHQNASLGNLRYSVQAKVENAKY